MFFNIGKSVLRVWSTVVPKSWLLDGKNLWMLDGLEGKESDQRDLILPAWQWLRLIPGRNVLIARGEFCFSPEVHDKHKRWKTSHPLSVTTKSTWTADVSLQVVRSSWRTSQRLVPFQGGGIAASTFSHFSCEEKGTLWIRVQSKEYKHYSWWWPFLRTRPLGSLQGHKSNSRRDVKLNSFVGFCSSFDKDNSSNAIFRTSFI